MRCFSFARLGTVGALTLGLACGIASLSHAQTGKRLGPDLLQTLGVGSRSIAMGNAFTAIADDASATFWNPGRLAYVTGKEFMLEYRSVVQGQLLSLQTDTALTKNVGSFPGKPQPTFISITDAVTPRSTLGISYTLGGYLNTHSDVRGVSADPNQVGQFVVTENARDLLIANRYLTLAFGDRQPLGVRPPVGQPDRRSQLGLGLGVYFVDQGYRDSRLTGSASILLPANTDPKTLTVPSNRLTPSLVSENGSGYGVVIGAAFDAPRTKNGSLLRFGMAYRTLTRLSGLSVANGASFNKELPERLSMGAAFEQPYLNGSILIISAETQIFGAANRGTINGNALQDQRRAVGNINVGVEFTRQFGGRTRLPIRFGFRTDSNAAPGYTYYDNVLSFGVAYQRLGIGENLAFSLEPTVEVMTSNGLTLFTLTGRLRF